MINAYREIFRPPGTRGFAAAAFFARLPIAMAAIGIVAMLSQTHGEYWLAGACCPTGPACLRGPRRLGWEGFFGGAVRLDGMACSSWFTRSSGFAALRARSIHIRTVW